MGGDELETTGNGSAAPAVAIQDDICTITGVRAARVVATPGGRISEIHVVADAGKSAKQVVRDIQTLAQARHGLQIDYRVISVVQLAAPHASGATSRTILGAIRWQIESHRTTCCVELSRGDGSSNGEASGAATAQGRLRLAAQATVEALVGLHAGGTALDVADVQITEASGRRVAVVVLLMLSRWGEQVLAGAAMVRTDEADAVVRAVLDAANRRMSAPQ